MTTAAIDDRVSQVAGSLVVVAAVAVAVAPGWWVLVPTVVLLAVAASLHHGGASNPTVWFAATCWGAVGLFAAVSFGLVWPIPQLAGLVAAGIVLRRSGWERPDWLGPGRVDRPARLLAVASVPLTTIALVAFIASGRTDLESATEGLQSLPSWTLPLVGIGFVLANPTVEEILFRGVLQSMAAEVSGRAMVGVAVQGVAFGAIHYDGVPGGPLGMLMAGAWGVVLGIVRHRTGSIRLAWIVHVLANVAIYSTVVTLAVRDGVL